MYFNHLYNSIGRVLPVLSHVTPIYPPKKKIVKPRQRIWSTSSMKHTNVVPKYKT